jgi:hypothetical protein
MTTPIETPSSETAQSSGWTRRRLLKAGLLAAGVLTIGGAGRMVYRERVSPWDPSRLKRPLFGMLQAEPHTYRTLRAAGVDAVTLSLAWSRAEPRGPGLDDIYLREVEDQHLAARDAGLEVALSTGLQYPPRWVSEQRGARFVDQNGTPWSGPMGEDAVDAVFNQEVRGAQDAYLQRLGQRLDDVEPAGIRVGGLGRGELHYPPGPKEEPRKVFWAFGPAALASSPVPHFRPGTGSPEEALVFLDWYMGSLAEYGRWQLDTYRRYFGPQPRLIVLLPSWGIRPGEIDDAAEGLLSGNSRGERRGTLSEGLDWERQVPLFAEVDGVAVCTTWLDTPDQGSDDSLTSPGVYLSALARRKGVGVWGENTGDNSAAEMLRCMERVRNLGLEGLFWMSGRELGVEGNARLEDYAQLIATGTWPPPRTR